MHAYMWVGAAKSPLSLSRNCSNFKNRNSGVSHRVLLTFVNQSNTPIHAHAARHFPGTHGPPLRNRETERVSIFPLRLFLLKELIVNGVNLDIHAPQK